MDRDAPPLLLVTGIPATGKTTFARWLESEHGYRRCPSGQEPGPRTHIEVHQAVTSGAKVVLDWGIPAHGIDQARQLIDHYGFEAWWFDGDREMSRQGFLQREGHPATLADFERYIGGIDQNWASYQSLFEDRVLDVLRAGPVYVSNEERLASIKGYQRS